MHQKKGKLKVYVYKVSFYITSMHKSSTICPYLMACAWYFQSCKFLTKKCMGMAPYFYLLYLLYGPLTNIFCSILSTKVVNFLLIIVITFMLKGTKSIYFYFVCSSKTLHLGVFKYYIFQMSNFGGLNILE